MSQFFNPFEGANGGGGGGGTSDYSELSNKPKINSVTLTGNKSLEDLGIVNTVVDSELSTTSENPVQNKIVTLAINEKLDIDDAVGKNTTGIEYTIGGQTVVAQAGAEIFNNYEYNQAAGLYSHAEGAGTSAKGSFSHAEGANTIASGSNSHAEGFNTQATGRYSHTEGTNAIASGDGSHAEGTGTTASGDSSHAEGNTTQTTGNYSHAEGNGTIASSDSQHAQGKYNISDANDKYAFIIGNGTSDSNRSNAFAVDWNGKIYVNGDTNGVDLSKAVGKNVEGKEYTVGGQTVVAKAGAEIFNTGKFIDGGQEFNNVNTATGLYSHAEGVMTTASGDVSHAEGKSTTASGWASHAEGEEAVASGNWSHAKGYRTTASGNYSHAEGYYTQATGLHSHAEGDYTESTATNSHAEGYYTQAKAINSHAEGNHTIAAGENQHVQGKYNIAQGDLNTQMAFIIGNGTSDQNRSNAFAIDWDGKVYINGEESGVDIHDLASGLIQHIDDGPKNLVNDNLALIKCLNTAGEWSDNVYTRYNIEWTVNADHTISVRTIGGDATSGASLTVPCKPLTGGEYILTGCPSGSGQGTNFDLRWGSSGTYRDFGDGKKISTTGSNDVYLRVNQGINIQTPVVYRPMLCTDADYGVSQDYAPYKLGLSDITQGITPLVDDVKNKIKLGFNSITASGVTVTQTEDGGLMLNGTNTSSSAKIIIYDLYDGNTTTSTSGNRQPLQPGNSYIVKGTGNSGVRIQLQGYNEGGTLASISNSSSDIKITSLPTYDYYVFRLYISSDASFNNLTIYPMCCSESDYTISQSNTPYAKTNRELTVAEQKIEDILTPMTQAEYDVLTTKTLPLYFVYEE